MTLRWKPNRHPRKAGPSGSPQLTLAHWIVTLEKIVWIFARPLMLVGVFVAAAWLGVFADLYPWAHLAAMAVFTLLIFDALRVAREHWKPVSPSEAKRRVEEASGLRHRPLDVLEDRPVTLRDEQVALWQAHVEQAKAKTTALRLPFWKLNFSDRDPYALRYALLILLAVGALSSWGVWGGRLIEAINPALGKELRLLNPTLDAWITPPDYTGLAPIMIATPAGGRHNNDVITVPEGSVISAHLAEKDGDAPELTVNNQKMVFTADAHGDFEAVQEIHAGETITIRRGWQTLGSWQVHVVADHAPQVTMTETPSSTERKTVRLAYEASDDYGVTSVTARVTPRESLAGASNEPMDIELATPHAKDVKRVSFEDLTAHPWSGLPVQIQLIATDAAGHQAFSHAEDFTLPERNFFHPVARALIEERKKLLQNPDDEANRNEAANVMAGIAHEPANYRGDSVVLMALRGGAVRLVLDHSREAVASVNDVLWQTAVRIEDGGVGMAEQNLRQAQKELADALDRNASERDIQQAIDRLRQALAQYMAQLASHVAATKTGAGEDLSSLLGPQTNTLTPQGLNHMLDTMRSLSASGAREAAREELAKLQQLMENLRTESPQLTPRQQQAIQQLKGLHEIVRDQQKLLDKTFQSAGTNDTRAAPDLGAAQNMLADRLSKLSTATNDLRHDDQAKLVQGHEAMSLAKTLLKPEAAAQKPDMSGAVSAQNQAIKALQQLEQSLRDDLRQSLLMLPRPGHAVGGASDPFGREFGGLLPDADGVKVPNQMETRKVREILDELQRRAGDTNRPKTERDYIDRLLQNF